MVVKTCIAVPHIGDVTGATSEIVGVTIAGDNVNETPVVEKLSGQPIELFMAAV